MEKSGGRPFSLYKGAVTVSLAARITSQVLLLSQGREYRAGAAGRVKQFEEFYLEKKSKKNVVSFSVELLKHEHDATC